MVYINLFWFQVGGKIVIGKNVILLSLIRWRAYKFTRSISINYLFVLMPFYVSKFLRIVKWINVFPTLRIYIKKKK